MAMTKKKHSLSQICHILFGVEDSCHNMFKYYTTATSELVRIRFLSVKSDYILHKAPYYRLFLPKNVIPHFNL